MPNIMEVIEKETKVKNYHTYKYIYKAMRFHMDLIALFYALFLPQVEIKYIYFDIKI